MSEQVQTIEAFIESSDEIFAETLVKAQALPANTVQVWPGGAIFNGIQAAIDSISNAGPQLQYRVAVGAGTFNENVVMKDNVYVVGSGQTKTFITALGQFSSPTGVVNTASNCGISEVTVTATSGLFNTWAVAVKIMGSGKFRISGASIISSDNGNFGNNVRGITNNAGSYGGQLFVGQSTLNVSGVSQSSIESMEFLGMDGLAVFIQLTDITVTAPSPQICYGIRTAMGATVTMADSKVSSSTWALYDADDRSIITASKCTIDGRVSGGVVVIP